MHQITRPVPPDGLGRQRADQREGTRKLLRVPAEWFIRRLAERVTGTHIPGLNSGLLRLPPPRRRALPAAGAQRGWGTMRI